MRKLAIFFFIFLFNTQLLAVTSNPLESDEALRSRIKIKFALDPLLSKEKITLQHQNGKLSLVGQVDNKIIEEQALYLIQQSNIQPDRIQNEIIVENKPLTPEKKQSLIEIAAKARLEAASKYQMKNIPFIGIKLNYRNGVLVIKGHITKEQKKEIQEVLNNFKQINRINFSQEN